MVSNAQKIIFIKIIKSQAKLRQIKEDNWSWVSKKIKA